MRQPPDSTAFRYALDALANTGGGFAGRVTSQILVFHSGDFDVEIDMVEEGAGDAVPDECIPCSLR